VWGLERAAARGIDTASAARWLARDGAAHAVTFIDIREPHELALGQIPTAISVRESELLLWLPHEHPDKSSQVILYCESGKRSSRAAEQLAALGYSNMYSLDGGFAQWKRAEFPIVKPHSPELGFEIGPEQLERYSRNVRLAQIGVNGQRQLLDAKVLIVGLGGLGTPAALYLAAAGVGTLGLVDDDVVELSNLQRQILHSTSRIGQSKVESAARALTELNRDVTTIPIKSRLNESNVAEIVGQGWDVIIDGCDNYGTRYALNDTCCALGLPVVFGSVEGFEGRVMTVVPGCGPCFRCAFPNPPNEDLTCSCDAAGVLGVLPGLIGVLQATEAIKLILSLGEPLIGRLLTYDALALRFMTVKVPNNNRCPACGTSSNFANDVPRPG